MSRMPTKDPGENQNGYRTSEFPFVLPKMQTGNVNSYITIKNIYYQRAGRKDAEPIIHESNLRSIGSVFVPYCMIVFLEDEDENSNFRKYALIEPFATYNIFRQKRKLETERRNNGNRIP